VLAFVMAFIALSLSGERASVQYTEDISDYCLVNPDNDFCNSPAHISRVSLGNYVRARCITPSEFTAAFISVWLVAFVCEFAIRLAVPGEAGSGEN
jgi:hypothetical protein